MNITQTFIGIGLASAIAQTVIELVVPKIPEAPPVEIVSISYSPETDLMTLYRVVTVEQTVYAPFIVGVYEANGGPQIDACRRTFGPSFSPNEPEVQPFEFDDMSGEGCREALLERQKDSDVEFVMNVAITPLDAKASQMDTKPFRVSE
jgi:hypothetical protein